MSVADFAERTGQCMWEKPQSLQEADVEAKNEWRPFKKYNTFTRKNEMYFNEYNGRVSRYDSG